MTKVGIGLFSSALVLAAAGSARADVPGEVFSDRGFISYLAKPGQTNVVTVSKSNSRIIIKDTAGLKASVGCTQTNSMTVSCENPGGNIKIDLQDGNDVFNGSVDQTLVVNGGPGNDTINGGSAADGLFGDEGNDVINGGGGGDFLDGGDGTDVVNGGDGDDQIQDRSGNDTINGGAGNDTIQDDGGVDVINGGDGNDTILSIDDNKDTINCGPGTDSYRLEPNDTKSGCENKIN